MDRARHPFLAGSRLAGHENGAVGARDLLDQLEDGEHLVAAADDVRELMGTAERPFEQHVLLPELALLESVAHLHLQLVDVERLAQVIVRPKAHRLDRGIRRRERCNHDAKDVGVEALRASKHVDASHVGHLDVGDEQIEPAALEAIDRRAPVFGQRHVIPLAAQDDRQQLAHRSLVVHDKELRPGSRFRVPGSGFGVPGFGFTVREFSVQRHV